MWYVLADGLELEISSFFFFVLLWLHAFDQDQSVMEERWWDLVWGGGRKILICFFFYACVCFFFDLPCMSINPWWTVDKWCTMDEWCTVYGISWLWNDLCNWCNDWGDDWFWMVINTALMAYGRWNVFDNFRYMVFGSVVFIGQWSIMCTISMDSTWSSNSNGNDNRQHQL